MEEKARILIVDDDEGTRRSLSLILGKKGYEVETAGTGREGMDTALREAFNLAILDIKLPDVEGVELLAPLKEIHPDMAVIMITAYASLETALRALNEGASAYVTKPLNMDAVLATVNDVLEKQHLVMENRRLYQEAQRELAGRKQAEEEVRQSAERWGATFDSIVDLVWIEDKDFKIVSVNKAFADTFKMEPGKAIGKPCYEIIHGRKEPWPNCPLKQTLQTKKPSTTEFFEPHLGIYLEASTSPIFDEKGEVVGIVHLTKDITERKQAEEALEITRASFRNIVERHTDGIIIIDQEGVVRFVNPAAVSLFGLKAEEFVGEVFGFPMVTDEMTEVDIIRSSGETGIAEMRVAKTEWEGESAYLASLRDITERKRAEEALRELDRLKSEFIANVSHELRTPLQSIMGFTKLLLQDKVPDPETQKEFLSTIDKQGEHLAELVGDLLDISRVESGRFSIQKQSLSIGDVIHSAVQEINSLAQEKGITIVEDLAATLPEVEADEQRLRQVMVNLLSNAIKFSHDGGEVAVRDRVKRHGILVEVSDRGIGIPAEAISHLFERFYQVDGSITRVATGAGLGLFISKQIVEAHGGRIWAESKGSKGSTFSFTVPLPLPTRRALRRNVGGKRDGEKDISHRR